MRNGCFWLVLLLTLHGPAHGQSTTDTFEGSSLTPPWTVQQQAGTISLSAEQKFSGLQAVKMASVADGQQRALSISRQLASPSKGLFTIYFYDKDPGVESLYIYFNLYHSTIPGQYARIGVDDYDAYCYQADATNAAGLNQGPGSNCTGGIYPDTNTTAIRRTAGWHRFDIDVRSTSILFKIDGALAFTYTGDLSFDRVTVAMSGPYWRPNTTAYIDDFVFTPATVETPSTASLSSISPNTAKAGSGDFTLYFWGAGISQTAVFSWNGTALQTGYVSNDAAYVYVPASLLATSGTALVTVRNPGEAASNAMVFTITPTTPVPVIQSMRTFWATDSLGSSPGIEVYGTGLQPGISMNWNGTPLPLYFWWNFGRTYPEVYVYPENRALFRTPGGVSITVSNAGNVTSPPVAYTIPPLRTITGVSPNVVTAGTASVLNIFGSGFTATDLVYVWAYAGAYYSYTPTFISPNQLQVTLPSNGVPNPGSYFVTVYYSGPGYPASGSLQATYSSNDATILATTLAPTCTYSVQLSASNFPVGGGTGSATVTAPSGCGWSANSPQSWLNISSGGSGSGNGTVNFSVAQNPNGFSRSLTLSVAGQDFTISQAAAVCTYSLGQSSKSFTAAGGSGTVSINAPTGCSWSATATSWIQLSGPVAGSGNGTISYTALPHAGISPRTGAIQVGGQFFAVVEAGAVGPPVCVVNPAGATFVAREGLTEPTGDITVSCSNIASSTAVNLTFFSSVNITNRITNPNTNALDATLSVNGGAPIAGTLAGVNSVSWPFTLPAGNSTLLLQDLRTNASQLGFSVGTQAQVFGNVTITGVSGLTMNNATQPLASVVPGLLTQRSGVVVSGTTANLQVRFREGFASAFKPLNGQTPGSRLVLRLANVPLGVSVYASLYPTEGAARARLVASDANGFGGSPVSGTPDGTLVVAEIPIVGGAGIMTWEVTAAGSLAMESLNFPLIYKNLPNPTAYQGIGYFANLGPLSSVATASTSAPVPRFAQGYTTPEKQTNLRLQSVANGIAPSGAAAKVGGAREASSRPERNLFVGPNSVVVFNHSVTNESTDPLDVATNVVYQTTLPTGLGFVSCSSTGSVTCAQDGNRITITYNSIPPGGSQSIAIRTQVGSNVASGTTLDTPSIVRSDGVNTDPLATSTSETVTVAEQQPSIVTPGVNVSGSPQVFTITARDPDGGTTIDKVYFLVNATSTPGPSTCYGYYDQVLNRYFLFDDSGATPTPAGGLAPGSGSVTNSQCTLDGTASVLGTPGGINDLVVKVGLTLKGAFAARVQNLYANAVDNTGLPSGWIGSLANWLPQQGLPPSIVTASPPTTIAPRQVFTVTARDTDGATTIRNIDLIVSSIPSPGGGICWVSYDNQADRFYLYDNSGVSKSVALVPGSATSVENSQCILYGTGSIRGTGGQASDLVVNIDLALKGSYGSSQRLLFASATDVGNGNSGWVGPLAQWNPAPTGAQPGTISPSSGTGAAQTFTVTANHTSGAASLTTMHVLFNSVLNGANSCWVAVNLTNNSANLVNDPATGNVAGSVTSGSGSASNSQCTLSGTGFTIAKSGNTVTATLPLSFNPYFGGPKKVFQYLADNTGKTVNWTELGTWTVPSTGGAPRNGTVSPDAGSGTAQTFTVTAAHTLSVSKLTGFSVLINSVLNGPGACWVQVNLTNNTAALVNDAATSTIGGIGVGTGSAANSQCSINGNGFTVAKAGITATVTLPISFTGGFAGAKKVYQYAIGESNQVTSWTQIGTWTVASAQGTPQTGTITPSSGSGNSQTFTVTANHTGGVARLTNFSVLISSVLNGPNACWVQVNLVSNTAALVNDAATTTVGTVSAGSGTATNSQCTLSGSGFTVAKAGTTATVTLPITFAAGFAGAKKAYQYVSDDANQITNWAQIGTWTVTSGQGQPQNGTITPGSGTGMTQTFTVTANHTGGVARINGFSVLFNSVLNGSGACWIQVDPVGDRAYLVNDAATSTVGSVRPGLGTVSNSQCTLAGTGFSVQKSGTTATVTIPLTFTAGFAGAKKAYQYVVDDANQITNWTQIGTWTVGAAQGSPQTGTVNPSSGTGMSQTFLLTANHTGGAAKLTSFSMLVNSVLNGPGACWVHVNLVNNTAALVNDAATGYGGNVTVGTGTVSNSQCTIAGSGFTVAKAGNTATVTIPVTFSGGFTGAKKVFEYVVDETNQITNWAEIGSWTVGTATGMQTGALTPASGAGLSQRFTASASHGGGANRLTYVLLLFNNVLNGPGSCWVQVNLPSNTVSLVNDAGTGIAGTLTTGPSTVSNSQCTISGDTFVVTKSATGLSFSLPITFKSAFSGPKQVYEYLIDDAGQTLSWTQIGTWTVQ